MIALWLSTSLRQLGLAFFFFFCICYSIKSDLRLISFQAWLKPLAGMDTLREVSIQATNLAP